MFSKKEEYAIRAVLELAFRKGREFIKVKKIASSQKIPFRFLEGILNQLRNAGLVESVRGQNGGYRLIKSPEKITVLDVLKAIGRTDIIYAEDGNKKAILKYRWDYALLNLKGKIKGSVKSILENTTIGDLIKLEESSVGTYIIDYTI